MQLRIRVSIPRRYAKNEANYRMQVYVVQVSIPRRYAKNFKDKRRLWIEDRVSIPRRYAKNFFSGHYNDLAYRFQSLVGTLKTAIIDGQDWRIESFQSLVGTLKTYRTVVSLNWSFLVSIPRRYAKNNYSPEIRFPVFPVSIPRRYAKNHPLQHTQLPMNPCFNPS